MSQLARYRLLGRSGLRVSPFSLGTMTFGTEWGWGSDEAGSRAIFDRYLAAGGNFLDTANFYTGGTSEEMLGRFLAGRRDRVVLATKFVLGMRPGDPNSGGAGRKNIVESCEASLRRLATDYIDLYIMHMWDKATPIEETMSALADLVRAGKVRYLGVSDTPAWKVVEANMIAERHGWPRFVSLQVEYSLVERGVERDLVPMAREFGLGLTPWSPLAGGFLSGKFSRDNRTPAGDHRLVKSPFRDRWTEQNLRVLDVLHDVARETGRGAAQVALAWVQGRPGVVSTILGARRLDQLEDNLAALELELSDDQRARLDAAGAIDLGFPHDFLANPFVMNNVRAQTELVLP